MKITVDRLNLTGLNRVMRSAGAQAMVNDEAKRLAAAAGPDFEAVARPHRWVARAYVRTANPRGIRRQMRDATLERVIGTARR